MTVRGSTGSLGMPSYRAILAVDAEKFSRNPSASLPDLSATIITVLGEAMARCGLDSVWQDRRAGQSTGDGYLLGTPPENLPGLIFPFLDSLQDVLTDTDVELRNLDRTRRLRLRVSIHVGVVPEAGDEIRDLKSGPTNDTFRLLDSPPVREALATSDPDVTHVAAILSQRAFEDAVLAGYTELPASRFTRVVADVTGKDFSAPAWLYVPRPSTRPHAPLTPVRDDPDGEGHSDGPAPRSGNHLRVGGNIGQSFVGSQISGNVRQSNRPDLFRRTRRPEEGEPQR